MTRWLLPEIISPRWQFHATDSRCFVRDGGSLMSSPHLSLIRAANNQYNSYYTRFLKHLKLFWQNTCRTRSRPQDISIHSVTSCSDEARAAAFLNVFTKVSDFVSRAFIFFSVSNLVLRMLDYAHRFIIKNHSP